MRFFSFRLMGCLLFSWQCLAYEYFSDTPNINEVSLNVEHVFTPQGFDSNDSAEIILSGWYPNPCYEWSRAQVTLGSDNKIHVQPKSFVRRGPHSVCIAMQVPFLESVRIGNLPSGTFHVQVGENHLHDLRIAQASSESMDDYLYGKVFHVRSEQNTLLLDIELPSSCIELEQMKTISDSQNTYVLLPIMKQVQAHCPRDPHTITFAYAIPEACMENAQTLFHVRSLDGKSANYLFRPDLTF